MMNDSEKGASKMSKTDRSRCHSLLSFLSDYVDGALSEQICQEIEQHLADCQDCHIVVDTLRKTISIVHDCSGTPDELPDQVRSRLFKTLNLEDYLK
jgi:anti-sigma factor RsiW